MEFKITEKKENPLLDRIEVEAKISYEGATPSNLELQAAIGKEIGKDATLVVVQKINTHFGTQNANVKAVVYNSSEAKDKAIMLTKHMKKQVEEAKKKAEEDAKEAEEKKAAEKPAAEPEAETASEESPTEEKPVEEAPAAEEAKETEEKQEENKEGEQ